MSDNVPSTPSQVLRFPVRSDIPEEERREEKTGICLSGGGIRSAMFCLGVLQGLQKNDGLIFGGKDHKTRVSREPAHLMSVVSGGSYIAGAFAKHAIKDDCEESAEDENKNYPDSHATYITGHSRYLTEGKRRYALPLIFNLSLICSLYVLLACTVALATFVVSQCSDSSLLQERLHTFALIFGLAFVTLAFLLDYRETKKLAKVLWNIPLVFILLTLYAWKPWLLILIAAISANWLAGFLYSRARWDWTLLAIPALLVGSLFLRPTVEHFSAEGLPSVGEVALISVTAIFVALLLSLALNWAGDRWKKRSSTNLDTPEASNTPIHFLGSWIALWTPRAVGASVVGLLAIWLYLSWSLLPVLVIGTSVAIAVLGWCIPSSMHREYRRRLMSCYSVPFDDDTITTLANGDIKLSTLREIAEEGRFPKLVISATGNARVSAPCTTTGWQTYSPFVLSYDYCGVPNDSCHDMDTTDLESLKLPTGINRPKEPLLSLFTAISCTGAAISPYLGRKTEYAPSVLRPFIAGANMRLGRWIPNPFQITNGDTDRYQDVTRTKPSFHSGSVFGGANDELLTDMVGLHGPRMYISDGGHSDNLGLMPLLHAGCKKIYLVDAGTNTDGDIPELRRLLKDAAEAGLTSSPSAADLAPFAIEKVDGRTWYTETHRTIALNYCPNSGHEGQCELIVLKLGVHRIPIASSEVNTEDATDPRTLALKEQWPTFTGKAAYRIMQVAAGITALWLFLVSWLNFVDLAAWTWSWLAVSSAAIALGLFIVQFLAVNSRLRGTFPHHQTFVAFAFDGNTAKTYERLGKEIADGFFDN